MQTRAIFDAPLGQGMRIAAAHCPHGMIVIVLFERANTHCELGKRLQRRLLDANTGHKPVVPELEGEAVEVGSVKGTFLEVRGLGIRAIDAQFAHAVETKQPVRGNAGVISGNVAGAFQKEAAQRLDRALQIVFPPCSCM